jgi:hypothetical protein
MRGMSMSFVLTDHDIEVIDTIWNMAGSTLAAKMMYDDIARLYDMSE